MAETTGIAWTDATWSPILGCSPASPGCTICYALRDVWRMAHNPNPKIATPRQGLVEKTSAGVLRWTGKVSLLPDHLSVPLRWRKPRRIFVANQADLFHENVPADFVEQVFQVMSQASQHTFQLLTKRAERMRRVVFDFYEKQGVLQPLPNAWLGVSVEGRRERYRIHELEAAPAALRYLSLEPLLEDLGDLELAASRVDWVIVGGESGQRARPCDPAWVRSIVAQCEAAGVPCFVKQLGSVWARSPRTNDAYLLGGGHQAGADPEEWPDDLRVQQFPEVD